MKHVRLMWISAVVVAIIYIVALLSVRVGSMANVQQSQYEHWKEHYVVPKTKNQSFVNTSNDPNNPVALSEGQGVRVVPHRHGGCPWLGGTAGF